jgi:hypothetical protein
MKYLLTLLIVLMVFTSCKKSETTYTISSFSFNHTNWNLYVNNNLKGLIPKFSNSNSGCNNPNNLIFSLGKGTYDFLVKDSAGIVRSKFTADVSNFNLSDTLGGLNTIEQLNNCILLEFN